MPGTVAPDMAEFGTPAVFSCAASAGVDHAAQDAGAAVTGAERGVVRDAVAHRDVGEVVGAAVEDDGATDDVRDREPVGRDGGGPVAAGVDEDRGKVARVPTVRHAVDGIVAVVASGQGEVRRTVRIPAEAGGVNVEAVEAG